MAEGGGVEPRTREAFCGCSKPVGTPVPHPPKRNTKLTPTDMHKILHLATEILPFDDCGMTLVSFACGEIKDLEEEADHVAMLPAAMFGFTWDKQEVTCQQCMV